MGAVPPREAATLSTPEFDKRLAGVRAQAERFKFDEALAQLNTLEPQGEVDKARVEAFRAGVLSAAGGDLREALALAEGALESLHGHGAPARYIGEAGISVGNARFALGEVELARIAWTNALGLSQGETPEARRQRGKLKFNLALIHEQAGRFDEALKLSRQGLADEVAGGARVCPGQAKSRAYIAVLLSRLDRQEEALEMSRRAQGDCAGVAGVDVARARLELGLAESLGAAVGWGETARTCREAGAVLRRDPQQVVWSALAVICEAQALRQLSRSHEAATLLASVSPRLDATLPEHLWLLFLVCTQRARALAEGRRMPEVDEELNRCEELASRLPNDRRGAALSEVTRLEESFSAKGLGGSAEF